MPRPQPKGKGFNFGAFEDVVLKDLIPLIDSTYRTVADREHRAIAGLSMGAAQAMQIGMTHLDTFSAVGAFSGAGKVDPKTAYGGVFADAGAFDKKVSLLYLHSGTVGLDAGIHKGAKALYEIAPAGRRQERGLPRPRGAGARVADLAVCPARLRPAVVPAEEVTRETEDHDGVHLADLVRKVDLPSPRLAFALRSQLFFYLADSATAGILGKMTIR